MQNIEIKARINNTEKICHILKVSKYKFVGNDHQIDTYFNVNRGRFKLRESSLSGPHLIIYMRDDLSGPKSSEYQIISVKNEVGLKHLLKKTLGIRNVIEKSRKIYLYKNVRIHLDQVKKLGNFLELEAVMDEDNNSRKMEIRKIKSLLVRLGIKDENLIKGSYENLIESPDN